MSLFRLDASIRTDGSHSRQIADLVEVEWRAGHPGDLVLTREVGVDPLPAGAWGDAVRKSRGRGLPGCACAVSVPASIKPNPSASHAASATPSLSNPAASPIGLGKRTPKTVRSNRRS